MTNYTMNNETKQEVIRMLQIAATESKFHNCLSPNQMIEVLSRAIYHKAYHTVRNTGRKWEHTYHLNKEEQVYVITTIKVLLDKECLKVTKGKAYLVTDKIMNVKLPTDMPVLPPTAPIDDPKEIQLRFAI